VAYGLRRARHGRRLSSLQPVRLLYGGTWLARAGDMTRKPTPNGPFEYEEVPDESSDILGQPEEEDEEDDQEYEESEELEEEK
jgi:hypothetical protein